MVRIGKVRSSGDMARLPLISLLKIISFSSLKIRYHKYEGFVKIAEKEIWRLPFYLFSLVFFFFRASQKVLPHLTRLASEPVSWECGSFCRAAGATKASTFPKEHTAGAQKTVKQ